MKQNVLCIALLSMVLGCGGGAGGGATAQQAQPAPTPPQGNPPPPANTGNATVVVNVVDIFGEPMAATKVSLSTQNTGLEGLTDAHGQVQFARVPGGDTLAAFTSGSDDSSGAFFGQTVTNLPVNGRVEIALTALPAANPVIGSTLATGDPIDVSADGRSLTLRLTLLQVQDHNGWIGAGLSLAPCSPDSSNDLAAFHADCVEGPAGFDRAYDVVEPPPSTWIEFDVTGIAEPYAAALLLDQSRRIVANDPWDLRLLGTKYLITNLASNSLMVAAFAADDLAAGEPVLLDDAPVTVIAVDADTSSYNDIDHLTMLEGGAAPLYAALAKTIDLVDTNFSSAGQRRIVVALTDGHDDTCGTAAQCRDARQAIVDKSIAREIDIVMLVLPGGTESDRRAVAELVAATAGRAFWPDDPVQLPVLLGMLPEVLRRRGDTKDVVFRLEADIDGTFETGRTVYGTLEPEICPWDCYTISFPIVFRIP